MSNSQKSYEPVVPNFPYLIHGADYNPDQWLDYPEILQEDLRLMKLAHVNSVNLGIFSWTALEPEEGKFTFDWLDRSMDQLGSIGVKVILATPSGARPAWMSAKYPEVRRIIDKQGHREPHRVRHNHCPSSPIYREKCVIINSKLAERYKNHPALYMWHVSNEYSAWPCYCEHCLKAFREWVYKKFDGNLAEVNKNWWNGFWSFTFTDWSEVVPFNEFNLGLHLAHKNFLSDQVIDFFVAESAPLRQITPNTPVTTNYLQLFMGIDFYKMAKHVDVVAWDNYPMWHQEQDELSIAIKTAFSHDLYRTMKGGKPFFMMESVPSVVQWAEQCTLKRPNMHALSSIQAIAHGSDSVQYFQWRKGRGGFEQHHGAVVDHVGHENTRVFKDVADLGIMLEKLQPVTGSRTSSDVAIIFDWRNWWNLDCMQSLGKHAKDYIQTCIDHYTPFWNSAVSVDIIEAISDFSPYKLIIAPFLYQLQPGVAEALKTFVKNGGTLVSTYWSGIADEHGLCITGGWPGHGLQEVFGIWDEEIDVVKSGLRDNHSEMTTGNKLNIQGKYKLDIIRGIVHAQNADVLARYTNDFYAGYPSLTCNKFGKGQAYYLAAKFQKDFLATFYKSLIKESSIQTILPTDLPKGISVQKRSSHTDDFIFIMNYNESQIQLNIGTDKYLDMISNEWISNQIELNAFDVKVLKKPN